MASTSKLDLELLQNGAANQTKANETFHQLNQLVQAGVVDRTNTPPGSPANEALYIITATATGSWAGKENQLAYWLSSASAWFYIIPREGFLVHVNDEDVYYKFDGSVWGVFSGGGGGATLPVVQALSSSRNIGLADINTFNVNSTGTDYTVTIQPQSSEAWTADAEIHFLPTSTGNIVITAGAGVSLNGVVGGSITLSTAYGAASIKRIGADSWWLGGVAGQQGASGDWCAAGGTANAATLTPVVARESYVTGDQFRARFSVTNTGAMTVNVSGLGVKTCKTVTGADTPAGYIRTDVDTVMTYDGTNFIVGREVERGSNANGYFIRHANGILECWATGLATDISTAMGSLFRGFFNWTLPAAYSSTTGMRGQSTASSQNDMWGGNASISSATVVALRAFSATTRTGITIEGHCTGFWY